MPKFDLNRVNDHYSYGRAYPHGKPHDAEYPKVKVSDYGKPADESQPQDHESQVASHDDVGRNWTNGYGSPHPHFDHSPPRSKLRR